MIFCVRVSISGFHQVYNIAERVFAAKMSQSDICGLMFGPTCGPVTAKQHTWKVNLPKKLRMGAKTNQVSDLSRNVPIT